MDEFACGMNDVFSLYDIVRANATAYLPLFVTAPQTITRSTFKQLCMYERSVAGSNKATEEGDTLYAFEIVLLNVEGNLID